MRKLMMMSGILLVLGGPMAVAAEPPAAEARAVVQKLGEQTVAAFAVDEIAERRRLLAEAAPAFDFQEIGRGVLNYVGVKVPDNREPEVIDGLAIYVKRMMASELDRIRPEKAEVGGVEMKGEGVALVSLTLAGPQDQLAGEWQVKKRDDAWRVTDIFVSGNSLVEHLGGKLSRRAAGGVDQLVEFLKGEREKIQKQMAQR